ncbi:7-carboxy-7-deazaguanine synthase QueE [Desulfurispirillum indicum]|uniref:7-carboxy-7-deazaguanine synthase QueE n=1 Tax=Desulfurispirillum indicum TaxID=936456 RepID=UPI001CFB0FC0|nr:7-carboxy-7-deazaguanine synthase QueE [Desulfurispirillum indicum]UCZ56005.1 7-carboxy-7-deazaguanine synthase QueE [Desulfurispirillum indicum]
MNAMIQEMFWSVQGEGPRCGRPQLFVRLHGCNLTCSYCDTPASLIPRAPQSFPWHGRTVPNPVPLEFLQTLVAPELPFVESVSITGGEPLCQGDFVAAFGRWLCQDMAMEVLLETNGTFPGWLKENTDSFSLVSADLKFPWAQQHRDTAGELLDFLQSRQQSCQDSCKIICDDAFLACASHWLDHMVERGARFPVVLQPLTAADGSCRGVEESMKLVRTYTERGLRIWIIPQMHHLLGVQ